MLGDFSEPICRACCNYEGIDRIEEVIERARAQKKQAEAAQHGRTGNPSESPRYNTRPGEVVEVLHTPVAIPTSIEQGAIPISQYVVSTTSKLGSSNNGPRTMAATAARMIPLPPNAIYHGHQLKQLVGHDAPPEPTNAQRIQLINETLVNLSKCTPFRVRFSKDHSLVGRAFAFDAVCRGSEYELKVYIEYPVGSGRVYQSASGAGRQMYGEFRERLGIGGGFKGASSNGYKDLEFEKCFGTDDWRVLGEMLTEDVRFFRGPLKLDLLPTPFIDPKCPQIPLAHLNANRGLLKSQPTITRKRQSGSDEEIESKKVCSSPNSSEVEGSPKSPSSNKSQEVSSPAHSEKLSPLQAGMQCMLCQKTLEDTRFVQCPSISSHKFCFYCSKKSIKEQSEASTDIYCPSGRKCLVMGSSTPWAFMETEIATILEAGSS